MVALLMTPLGRAGMALTGVIFFLGWFAFDQQNRGATKVVAKIEKANTNDVKKAQTAGAKSRSNAGGVLDPYTASEN
jgi:hypothetical protein